MDQHERARDLATSPHGFERYALSLLGAVAASSGKSLLVGNEVPRDFGFADAFAPEGIVGLPAPTVVEIRLRLNERLLSWLEKTSTHLMSGGGALLVVRENREAIDRWRSRIELGRYSGALTVFGKEELDDLAKRFPVAALPFASGSLKQALSVFISSTTKPPQRESHLASLRAAFHDDKLALFLGAGVSRSVGLPDWNALVQRVSETVFDDHTPVPLNDAEREQIHDLFAKEGPSSPLMLARLLRTAIKSGFADAVRGALYRSVKLGQTSRLLNAIARLCAPPRGRTGLAGVVTYNFDDLLEERLNHAGIQHRSVFTEGERPSRTELPVYHVHGFLPRADKLTSDHKKSLVFSEEAYHLQFTDPYLWTNIVQLGLLRSQVCLFVGFSMTDPNQRRLLEITLSKDATVRHYAILRSHWSEAVAADAPESVRQFARIFHGLEEASLASLGITVLWVNSHEDVAQVLEDIAK